MDDLIECVNGPCDGRLVSAALGARWPAATIVGYGGYPHSHLVGYYVLRAGEYVWDSSTVETVTVER